MTSKEHLSAALSRVAPLAGIIGPVLFVVLVLLQYALKRDFDIPAWPISALAVGERGWIQPANFALTATLLGTFGLGVRRLLGGGLVSMGAAVLLSVAGFFMLWAAIFPIAGGGGAYDPQADPGIHAVASLVVFPSAGIGVILASVALRRREDAQKLGAVTLVGGILVLVCFVVIGAFARSPGMPLNGVFGVLQMGVVVGWMGSVFLMALRWRSDEARPERV